MADFPKLKSNAVAQYPATKAIVYRNQTLRFLDGREQRYRDSAGSRREWMIRLIALDAAEVSLLSEFFSQQRGRLGSFAFTDPWDGARHEDCSLDSDELQWELIGELSTNMTLKIVENRS